jgi:hypothetical protein
LERNSGGKRRMKYDKENQEGNGCEKKDKREGSVKSISYEIK